MKFINIILSNVIVFILVCSVNPLLEARGGAHVAPRNVHVITSQETSNVTPSQDKKQSGCSEFDPRCKSN